MSLRGWQRAHQHVVLIVEDSDDTRESMRMLFELNGYRVAAVANGLEALHLMETLRFRPCIIVADLLMAKMDGLTFRTEQLKHPELAAIPVVAVTGHEGLRRHALDMDFSAALLKPCD